MTASWRIIQGDCRDVLRGLADGRVHTVVTSPPYFGLRDYGVDGQLGLEPTPDEFVRALVAVFREVRRVLRDDGTVWLNLGDSYAHSTGQMPPHNGAAIRLSGSGNPRVRKSHITEGQVTVVRAHGCKPKDLIGIPWAVAFALRADGWYLRSDIIWAKPNPMPESVTDRPTKAHEYLFLLAKRPRYYYDADAIRESHETPGIAPGPEGGWALDVAGRRGADGARHLSGHEAGRNKRSVWTVATQPYAGAHFATFPPQLIEPCILAGSPPKCCGVCGAPWERVVERELRNTEGWGRASKDHHAGVQGADAITRNGQGRAGDSTVRTVGWRSTCEHDDDTGRATVLDPFAGAGTTGMVALRHGRSFVGIELNPEYVRLARDRIIADAPLLNSAAELGLLDGEAA